MTPELLFDIAQQPWRDWPWLLLGLAIVAGAARAWHLASLRGSARGTPGFFLAFGAVCLGMGLLQLWDLQRLQAALREGRVQVLEGWVSSHAVQQQARYDTQSKRWSRSTWEVFRVGDTAFGFARDGSAGFRNAAEPAVALRDGDRLRLHYVEDVPGDFSQRRILRLERYTPAAR